MAKNSLDKIALVLVIIGALNWGLVGLLNIDLVQATVGSIKWLAKIIYILVGVSGIYAISILIKK